MASVQPKRKLASCHISFLVTELLDQNILPSPPEAHSGFLCMWKWICLFLFCQNSLANMQVYKGKEKNKKTWCWLPKGCLNLDCEGPESGRWFIRKWNEQNVTFLKRSAGLTPILPPSLPISPPSLLLIPLCFLISALLCFGFPGVKGEWLAVNPLALRPPSAASPSGSASWITMISQVLHYQPSLHILLQVINAQTREPVPSAALSVKFQGPGPSRGSAPCPGREGITFHP